MAEIWFGNADLNEPGISIQVNYSFAVNLGFYLKALVPEYYVAYQYADMCMLIL